MQEAHDIKITLATERLYKEYDNLVYQFRVPLGPCVIRIDSTTSRMGSYSPSTGEITLSENLVFKNSWDNVIEVLKHEMAHKLAMEIFGADHTHGPVFQKACDRMGVADWAKTATGELPYSIPDWREKCAETTEDRMMARVEKLLALAQSTNENEAALAMQRVQELYLKYNLERISRRARDGMVHLHISRKKKRIESYEAAIFSILGEHFFVQVLYTTLYDPELMREYKAVELLGTPKNVEMAEYVYHFLWNTIHNLWKVYQKETGDPGRYKRSYLMGVLNGFREKLRAAESKTDAESRALIKSSDADLQRYMNHRHPRIVTVSRSAPRADAQSYYAGREAGERLNLNKGVHNRSSAGPKLLT